MRSVRFVARFVVTAIALILVVLTSVIADAQEPFASLRGRVTDVAGRGLKDIAVVAQSPDLIRQVTTHTGTDGYYAFAGLPPGRYIIGFSGKGLVPLKFTQRILAGEAAINNVTMRPQDGNSDAITVTMERPWPPPSWTTSLESRHTSLDQLPVTGTVRSVIGLVTELPGRRPDSALFLLDGLPLRYGWQFGSPVSFVGPGPESIQEITIVPGRLPADYGRLQTGAIMAVTRSGSNRLAGSIRAVIEPADQNAEILRAARDADGFGGSFEYTLGGAAWRDHTWFFATGRHLSQSVADHMAFTDAPYTTDMSERFGTAKLTHLLSPRHRVEAQWVGARQRLDNALPAGALRVADDRALAGRVLSDRAFSGAYYGHLGLDVMARYTRENGTSRPDGLTSPVTLTQGTPLTDQQTGVTWWAPGSCAACDPDRSTHATARFTVGGRFGSHYLTAGYDGTRDDLDPASQPAAGSFSVRATRTRVENGVVYPVFIPGGSTWIVWTPNDDRTFRVRTDGLFIADRWSAGDRLEFDLGVRVDQHRATVEPTGVKTISDQAISPRLFATWRPSERLPWTLTAGFGRYVGNPLDRGLDASLALRPATRVFAFNGPAVNATGGAVPSDESLDRLYQWFFSQGGTSRASAFAIEPGVSMSAVERISPPRVDEWSFGVSRPLGQGFARADFTLRSYNNLPFRQIDLSAPVIDAFGRALDAGPASATDLIERRYAGLALHAKYRVGHYADVEAQYTYSRLRGNADERLLNATGLGASAIAYPEYFDASWHLPTGALPEDAPHRFRVWAHSEIIADEKRGVIIVTLVHSRESGQPYGAMGLVNVQPFVTNPGYFQPPIAVNYFFTDRDAFRTARLARTDLGITYRKRLPGTVHGDLFATIHVLNLLNAVRVRNPEVLVVTRTAFTDPSLQQFNPFTQAPVEGVHWTFDDSNANRDTATSTVPTTLGRVLRFTLGIRF